MNCKKVKDNLTLYIDDELLALDRKQIEKHLSNCVSCREEYNAIKEVSQLVGSLEEKTPPAGFKEQVLESIEKEKSRNKILYNFYKMKRVAAAAVIFFFLLGNGLIWSLNDEPYVKENTNKELGVVTEVRMTGPGYEEDEATGERETGEADVTKSSQDLAAEMEKYEKNSGISEVIKSSLKEESSSYWLFNGIYIPLAGSVLAFLKVKDNRYRNVRDDEIE